MKTPSLVNGYLDWDVGTFFSYYTMCFVSPILFIFWKILQKTKFVRPEEADLVWERPVIDAYQANLNEAHLGFWEKVKIMMGFKKKSHIIET